MNIQLKSERKSGLQKERELANGIAEVPGGVLNYGS